MRIAAGIVTYNPSIKLLEKNIQSIITQVNVVVICDNGSDNIEDIEKIASQYNIIIIRLKQNCGIAYALNAINEWCVINGYKWLLTLDQDSEVKSGLVNKYIEHTNIKDVAMMSCEFMARDNFEHGTNKLSDGEDYKLIEKCYTSGAFINTNIIKKVGGFDEYLFIDFVDFDMCITLLENNYKIIRLNYLGLIHEVGKTRNVKFLGKKEQVYNHNAMRKYYMSRNGIIYARKHKQYFGKKETTKRILSVFKRAILVLFYEKNKIRNIKSGISGIIAGITSRKKQWSKNSSKKEIIRNSIYE